MKLFFKHLARSILKKPLQPIILVFTLTLAIAVSIFSFAMRDALAEEVRLGQEAQYGNAQITIGLSGDSSSRFMFADDAETVLDGDGVAAGIFELPLFVGESQKTVFGVATDFTEIGKIFNFTFTDYGIVTPSTIGQSAFVSQAFAMENGLKVGGRFEVTAFGEKKTYTVCGISPRVFMDGYDVMVDITGVIRLITDDSPLLSALGDNFRPSSTIFVHLNDGISINASLEKLAADERFAEKTLTDVSLMMQTKSNADALSSIIDVSVVLSALLAAGVTFCCFYILSSERTEENYTFTLSGAKPWMLNTVQYAEITVYWLISALMGCGLAVPMTKGLFSLAGFRYAGASLRPLLLLLGSGILLFVALATVTLFILSHRFKRKNKSEKAVKNRALIVTFVLFAICFISTFIAPMGWRFWLYILLIICISLFILSVTAVLIKWFTSRLNVAMDKTYFATYRLRRTPLRYALKNIFSVNILHNISRLVALLTCILLTSGLMVLSTFGTVEYTETFFNADYVVLNATVSCEEKIAQCRGIENKARVFFGESDKVRMISTDNLAIITEDVAIQQLPQGNQVILASGMAKRMSLKVGDTFTQTIDGKAFDFVVFDVVDSGMAFILFDSEHFGVSYNMMMIKGTNGVPMDGLMQELTDKTALELAAVIPVEELFEDRMQTIYICLRLALMFLTVSSLFACVGMVDNLYESYRARREEFALYAYAGMSGAEIRRMKIWEILLTFTLGFAFGAICFVAMAFASNASFHSFGAEIFISLRHCFR